MKFFTSSLEERPINLSDEIRRWAWDSLQGKYGDEALQNLYVLMDDIEGFADLTPHQKHDLCIKRIAQTAPIRICEHELVSGSATLGYAIFHSIPAVFAQDIVYHSVSHITLNFRDVVRFGVDAIEEKIVKRLEDKTLTERKKEFLNSLLSVIDSMHIWHNRYLEALKDIKPEVYNNLLQVPFKGARNFYEAVQSLWFTFAFTRLCGNWPGIGRIDLILGEYLERDIKNGDITYERAREIMASFFIKGCEWIRSETPKGTGDAQHYQNIVLSGIDEDGDDVTNDVTYIILDIIEELGISDFPISVRISKKSDPKLLRRVAQVMRHGGGVVAVYNEDTVLKSLEREGYPEREARKFANDGCWEVQIPGKTYFIYYPFDSLQILQNITLEGFNKSDFGSYEELYRKYVSDLHGFISNAIFDNCVMNCFSDKEKFTRVEAAPCSVVSLFEDGCIENAASYHEGGPVYNLISPHIGGAPDTVNSLYAIKKIVFDDKLVSFSELMDILKNNWEMNEALRSYVSNNYSYYGNDNDEVDEIMTSLLSDFADICNEFNKKSPIRMPAGVSTFGRQIDWAPVRCATAFGRKKGDVLASNASATPGTDTEGATALVKSYCKADLTRLQSGAALDLKLTPKTIAGENGLSALIGLLYGFINLGGFFMQVDTVDSEVLRQAQENPEMYKTLSVRISGWNARFVTLQKEWQDMIIERTEHGKI